MAELEDWNQQTNLLIDGIEDADTESYKTTTEVLPKKKS